MYEVMELMMCIIIKSDGADVDEVTMVTLCYVQLHHGRWMWLLRRIHLTWCEWRGSHQHIREVHWLTSSTSSVGTRSMLTAARLKVELRPAVDLTGSVQGHCKDTVMTHSTSSYLVCSHLAHTTSGSASNYLSFTWFWLTLCNWTVWLPVCAYFVTINNVIYIRGGPENWFAKFLS